MKQRLFDWPSEEKARSGTPRPRAKSSDYHPRNRKNNSSRKSTYDFYRPSRRVEKTSRSKQSRVDSSRKRGHRHSRKGSPASDGSSSGGSSSSSSSSSSSGSSSSSSSSSESDDSESSDSSPSSADDSSARRSRRQMNRQINRRSAKSSRRMFQSNKIMQWVRSGSKARRSSNGKPYTVVGSRRSSNTVADALALLIRLMDDTCAEAKVRAHSSSTLMMAMAATGTTIDPDTAVPNYPGISYQNLLQLRAVAVGYAHSDGLFSSSQKRSKCSRTSLPPLLMNSVYQFSLLRPLLRLLIR